jgi:diphthamide biosynthesis protein 4
VAAMEETTLDLLNEVIQTDLYDVLGVSPSDPMISVKTSYQRLLLQRHPDKLITTTGPQSSSSSSPESTTIDNTTKFQEIMTAWKILSDPVLKKEYDQRRQLLSIAHMSAENVKIDKFVKTGNLYRYRCRCGEYYEV